MHIVSVPYRGATFLNKKTQVKKWRENIVSVPYRGATFLNPILLILETSKINSFRPLSGSYISQCVYNPYSNYDDGFRPLSGSYISQSAKGYLSPLDEMFPSPIGELHFSIVNFSRTDGMKKVSVPYRGATFLNTIPATPCSVWDR